MFFKESAMRIAFDIDGVLLLEDDEPWIVYFEQVTGRQFDRECFARTHCWNSATGMGTKELTDLYLKKHLATHDRFLCPTPGAKEAVSLLRTMGSCHVVTARDLRIKRLTLDLLHRHFGSFDSYEFGHVESKVAPLQRLGATVFIEDSAYQAKLVAEEGIPVIFFPQPRSVRHLCHDRHPKVIYPSSANRLREGMVPAELDRLHRETWHEIINICQDFR